jgi:hypothetical protein
MNLEQAFLSQVLMVVAVLVRIYAILWVAKDIASRTQSGWMQCLSILLIVVATPLIGLPLYFLMRPQVIQRDEYWKQQLLSSSIECVYCSQRNAREFEFCTFCGEKLKHACKQCHKPYALSYEYCPFCGGPNLG